MRQINKNTITPLASPDTSDIILGQIATNSNDNNIYTRQKKSDVGIDRVVDIYKGMKVHNVGNQTDRDNLIRDGKIQVHQICRFNEQDADGTVIRNVTMMWLGYVLGWRLISSVTAVGLVGTEYVIGTNSDFEDGIGDWQQYQTAHGLEVRTGYGETYLSFRTAHTSTPSISGLEVAVQANVQFKLSYMARETDTSDSVLGLKVLDGNDISDSELVGAPTLDDIWTTYEAVFTPTGDTVLLILEDTWDSYSGIDNVRVTLN